jgi:hypothetical protein
MAATEDQNKLIKQLIYAYSAGRVPTWNFEPLSRLQIGDSLTEAHLGCLHYQHALYEIGAAFQVRDWVFVTERYSDYAHGRSQSLPPPHGWICTAFHGDQHFMFAELPPDLPLHKHVHYIISMVLFNWWKILHPEISLSPESIINFTQEPSLEQIRQDYASAWNGGLRGGHGCIKPK